MKVAILTISDTSARGEREDRSGPAIRDFVEARGDTVIAADVIADEADQITARLLELADRSDAELILTTGGTGFAPRDVTPEATLAVIERPAPGIAEAMRLASLAKTPMGALSRGIAGIRGRTLMVNLPGSPRAVVECLEAVHAALVHGIDLLHERAAGHPPRQPTGGEASTGRQP
jgi:molybdenum cofactor synthesis domain-containing protein